MIVKATIGSHIYYLKPCVVVNHNLAVQILSDIRSGEVQLCQRLIDLFPRADTTGHGIPLEDLPATQFEGLFFAPNCVVEQLLKLPQTKPVEKSIKNPPLKTTDDPVMDIFARLSVSIGIKEAWLLIQNLSFVELTNWQISYNEASRPIEDRRKEFVDKLWAEQIAETPEEFYTKVIATMLPIGREPSR